MFDFDVVIRAGQTGACCRLEGPSAGVIQTSDQLFEIDLYHDRALFWEFDHDPTGVRTK